MYTNSVKMGHLQVERMTAIDFLRNNTGTKVNGNCTFLTSRVESSWSIFIIYLWLLPFPERMVRLQPYHQSCIVMWIPEVRIKMLKMLNTVWAHLDLLKRFKRQDNTNFPKPITFPRSPLRIIFSSMFSPFPIFLQAHSQKVENIYHCHKQVLWAAIKLDDLVEQCHISGYLYQMVTRNILRTHEEKQVFSYVIIL